MVRCRPQRQRRALGENPALPPTFPQAQRVLRTSAAFSQLVHRAPISCALASDVNPSAFGQTVRLTATLTPAGPTGRVSFYDGGNLMGTAAVREPMPVMVQRS